MKSNHTALVLILAATSLLSSIEVSAQSAAGSGPSAQPPVNPDALREVDEVRLSSKQRLLGGRTSQIELIFVYENGFATGEVSTGPETVAFVESPDEVKGPLFRFSTRVTRATHGIITVTGPHLAGNTRDARVVIRGAKEFGDDRETFWVTDLDQLFRNPGRASDEYHITVQPANSKREPIAPASPPFVLIVKR